MGPIWTGWRSIHICNDIYSGKLCGWDHFQRFDGWLNDGKPVTMQDIAERLTTSRKPSYQDWRVLQTHFSFEYIFSISFSLHCKAAPCVYHLFFIHRSAVSVTLLGKPERATLLCTTVYTIISFVGMDFIIISDLKVPHYDKLTFWAIVCVNELAIREKKPTPYFFCLSHYTQFRKPGPFWCHNGRW